MVAPRRLGAIAVLALLLMAATGCGPHSLRQAACLDPTDDCNWSVIVVENDLGRPVILRGCYHHCGAGDRRGDPISVAPGAKSPATQYGGISVATGDHGWVAVESASGTTLGCLVLDGHADKNDGDLVLVSELSICGNGKSSPASPIGKVQVQAP